MVEAGIALSQIAVEAGLKKRELQTWFENREPSEQIEARLIGWIRDVQLSNSEIEPWVSTETTQKIMGALEFAKSTPTIVVIYGGAGVSKTTTAIRYVDSHSIRVGEGKAYYVSASRWIKSPTAILEAIAERIGLYAGAYRNEKLAKSILEKVGTGDLLVIDEAQHLDADALDGIRYFFDEGGIGIAYLGNEMVHTRISGRGRSAAFAQLHSRVGMRLHIAVPTEADVDTLLEAWMVSGRQERDLGQKIGRQPGGLRTLTQVLRQSRIVARAIKRSVDYKIMFSAADSLGING